MAGLTLVAGSADAALCSTWNQKLRDSQNARLAFERQWHQNLAFYGGKQWITTRMSPDGNGFILAEAPATDKNRVRFIANRIKRIIRQEVAKLSKEEPQFYTKPASTDESDRAAAMAADAIAEYLLINKKFNVKRTEATFWACICGTGFLKNWYDPNAIELDGLPGAIDFEAVTAWHLFVPYLQVEDIQRQPYVQHTRIMSPEDVWNTWGKEVEPNTNASNTIIDSRFLTSLGINQSRNKASQMCYVIENWVKPCKNFPKGAQFVVTENQVLYVYEKLEPQPVPTLEAPVGETADTMDNLPPSRENEGPPELSVIPPKSVEEGLPGYKHCFPFQHAMFPFAKINHIRTGTFYGESVIKDLIPVQKEYNRSRSIMLETRNIAAKPQYAYIKGSFNPQHFNAVPGLLLAINLGFEPPRPIEQPLEHMSVMGQDVSMSLADMDDISSQFEITKGRTPPGVEAASAIAYLQEENDTILFDTVQSIETAVQDTGQMVLSLVHDYWDAERIVTITSRNQSYEVRKFKSSTLKPMSDFRVETGSMAPRSEAAKQAFITEAMKMGWVGVKSAFKFLPMSETKKMYDEMMLDDRQAQRENMRMADGEQVNVRPSGQMLPDPNNPLSQIPVPKTVTDIDEMGQPVIGPDGQPVQYIVTTNSFDNHETHVEVHQNYMKTQEWELLPDEIKQIFEQHVEEHKKELLKEMFYSQNGVTRSPVGETPPPGGPEAQPIQEGEIVQ